jgi:penicillin amidase
MSFQSRDTKAIRIFRLIGIVLAGLVVLVICAVVALYLAIRGSLPTLDGEVNLGQLAAPVAASRDANGTVSITAANHSDAMRALGFVHAQERFFEMDLARRSAAGELSALLGKVTLKSDQEKRVHRFRARLKPIVDMLPDRERNMMQAYADGVNAGLDAMRVRPWQYLALRASPEPWQPVDSLLVVAEMYSMLQLRSIDQAFGDALLRQKVGDKVFNWLKPRGGEWDGALDGSVMPAAPMPTPDEFDARKIIPTLTPTPVASVHHVDPTLAFGSNAWAINGALTGHGGAMLSNDMHLGLQVPNIWFRAQLTVGSGQSTRTIAGVTLPGIPGMVVGSNGDVAWGFTNSYGQWFDWVPATGLPVLEVNETIVVKGGDPVVVKVRETDVGPITKRHNNVDYALAWMAHRPGAINLRMAAGMLSVRSVDDAVAVANGAGMPHQNMFIADRAGNIAWTIAGLMPERRNASLQTPRAGFADAKDASYQALDTNRYPVVKNPPLLRVWSGNNRQLAGERGALIGDGGFDLGARGKQIRDRMFERDKFNEPELINIQYDDEARFLKRWKDVVTFVAAEANKSPETDVMSALGTWNGRADVDQVGYRFLRAFRARVHEQLWTAWIAAAAPGLDKLAVADGRFEYAVWQAITAKPQHLLPPAFTTWEAFLGAQAAAVADELVKSDGSITAATWGARNKTAIKHPFSRLLPALSPYLDMPATPQSGDTNMPSVAGPAFGASERLSVSPGREQDGILTMPGGQSGHPLSPFYGAGHQDWVAKKNTPLLAGPAAHTLQFR